MSDQQLMPMEARLVRDLPTGAGWHFEPKWDGFRCLIYKDGKRVELQSKSGKSLARFFPEVVMLIASAPYEGFTIDGELIIEAGGKSSFDALQMRLRGQSHRKAFA
jgi:ATP-dependent DNA ligase